MNDRRRVVLYGTLVVLALTLLAVVVYLSRSPNAVAQSATQAPSTAAPLTVGSKAPDFSATTTGGPFTLSAVQGRPVFLELFATWCPHCQRETAVLNALFDAYGRRVAFVAVSGSNLAIDGSSPESQQDVVQFIQRFNVHYPVAYDASLSVAHAYLQGGFPTIVIVGRNGKVRFITSGEIPQADLQRQLDAALSS